MAISFHVSEELKFHVKQKRLIKSWIKSIIEHKSKKLGDINYIFQTDDKLLELNNSALQHNYYTDIITFDYCENNTISGDLFISIDRVKENALNFAVPFEEEFLRVLIHGVLHLLGYGDKSKKDELVMREEENKAIEIFKVSRGT